MGISRSLPSVCPAPREARRCLPSRGSCGPQGPTVPGTLLRADGRTAPLRSLRVSLASRSLGCCVRSWCPFRAPGLGEAPRPPQGVGSPGPPCRAWDKETEGAPTFPRSPSGGMPRSQTPVVSCARALAHPGLWPSGHWKPSAFPAGPLQDSLVSTTRRLSGRHHAACLFVPSRSVRPFLGVHVDVTPDLLARLSSEGTCAISARTHWVTATNCMGVRPLPRFRASLGATTAGVGVDLSAPCKVRACAAFLGQPRA